MGCSFSDLGADMTTSIQYMFGVINDIARAYQVVIIQNK